MSVIRGKPKAFLEKVLAQAEVEHCILWPYAIQSRGYAVIAVKRVPTLVHRIICERVWGPAPAPNMEAAHFCQTKACINPAHIRWVTPTENRRDSVMAGANFNPGAKISPQDVEEIKSLYASGLLQKEIAKKFNVQPSMISRILTGVRHAPSRDSLYIP
jgi:HNH endonuclease/Helix-turn-helix domain